MRLVDRRPALGADELVQRLHPPRRFMANRFDGYLPNAEHPSQAAALAEMRQFSSMLADAGAEPDRGRRWFRRRNGVDQSPAGRGDDGGMRPGRYLDGGYGVGKTHLLASLWHEAPDPKAYLTFAELTSLVGFFGMSRAIEAFRSFRLLCVDEFELDDVANTLLAVTFLRAIVPGTKIAATSNTLPDKLGEGRFAARDFQREIAAIASHFDIVTIDGPDYRARQRVDADPFASDPDLADAIDLDAGQVSVDDFGSLLEHLRVVHPVQVGALLDDLDTVALRGLHPIGNQGDALLFVHFVDEVYDAGLRFLASGCPVNELFPESYRHGGYRKKYGRCESRLSALLGEVRASRTR